MPNRTTSARSRALSLSLWIVVLIAGCSLADSLLPSVFSRPAPPATHTPIATPTATPTRPPTAAVSPTATATVSPTAMATVSPTAMATPSPTVTATPTPEPLKLTVQFDPSPVQQGRTLLISLTANRAVAVSGVLDNRPLLFISRDGSSGLSAGGSAWAVTGIPVDATTGVMPLLLSLVDDLGRQASTSVSLTVTAADYGFEQITLPADRLALLDGQLGQQEAERLHAVFARVSLQRLWEGVFIWPYQGKVTASYGMARTYNNGSDSHHGGIDISGDWGAPVLAAAAGQVALAAPLQVRGNAVVIDHGLGVYSCYYHLSAIGVSEGQRVAQGETIGRLGDTGLSTGAHLHWEMSVGGVPVDPEDWTTRQIPGPGL